MAHVFISYAHTDHDYARKLADYLLANGFDVWIDDRIDFGSRWVRSIFEALDGCAAFIVVMTPRSNESEFVEKEYLRAADQKKPTFPLLLDGRSFPYFVGIQYYDVHGGKLPGNDFLERLAKFAPRSAVTGQDVTSATEVASKLTPSPDATGEYLTAAVQPAAADNTSTPRMQTNPPIAPVNRSQRRGSFLIAAVALIVAAIVVIAAVVHPFNNAASKPTLTVSDPTASIPAALTPAVNSTALNRHEQIAFKSNRDGSNEIYLMDTDGSHLQRLTDNGVNDSEPTWSPDGTQLVFVNGDNENAVLYVMNADGSNAHALGINHGGWNPDWSPDGEKMAFAGYGNDSPEIFVADIAHGIAQALTNDLTNDDHPRWSPDGTEIVFMSERDGNPEIYIMDADGTDVRRLTADPGDDLNPAWSPDGTQIAFESNRGGFVQIYLMASDGTGPHPISSDPGDSYKPNWSPDGKQIVFTSYRDSNTEQIYAMNADGTNVRRLTNSQANDTYPAWRP